MEKPYFTQLITLQATKYGGKPALLQRNNLNEQWSKITWTDFASQVNYVANAFLELGVKEQSCVGQFSQNKSENLIVDFALFANRAIVVPMYATSTVSQVEFIVNDAEIEIICVGDQQQFDIAMEVLVNSKFLKKIIAFDNTILISNSNKAIFFSELLTIGQQSQKQPLVQKRQTEASLKDLACILYTSGTTGNPKGVMLSHLCFNEAMRGNSQRLSSISDKDISVAFLPLSHVFERTWCYLCLFNGVSIYLNLRPVEISQTIQDVRPTLMCAVPRFWEKVYSAVNDNMSKFSPLKLGVVAWAMAVGKKHNVDHLRLEKAPSIFLKLRYFIADKLIFSKVKKKLGLENANILPTAGAKLSDEIALFFRTIGVPIVYGYGLTESTATVSCFEYTGYEIGTVGSIMPNLQVKIGHENEILLKGDTIFTGYYRNAEATNAAFTPDGWFKTGDAGYMNGNAIVLTDRIKDLFKTSNGKYIAPQEIETRLSLDAYIEQAATIGDERNFVTAIIAPAIPAIEEYAQKQNLKYNDIDELLALPVIHDLIKARIEIAQNGMSNYEMIKKFILIKKGFTIESGELTNTLKMRRAVILQKYKLEIEAMYNS